MRVLAKKEMRDMGWRLAKREEVLPTWERRGRVEACGGDVGASMCSRLSSLGSDPCADSITYLAILTTRVQNSPNRW